MTDLTLFETERLVLSGWRADQIDDLIRLHGDPTVARFLTPHGQPWSREQMEKSLQHWIDLFASRRLGKLRVTRKSDGVLVGRAGFGTYPPGDVPEIGYSLYPEHWGNGYAFEAASGLRDWYFRETDGDHFIGLADVRNDASLKVLDRIGMTRTHIGMSHQQHYCQFFLYNRPAA